jgi:signal transduction histidine kinase
MTAYWTDRVAEPDMEARLEQFTELVATAIANAEGRAALTASRARVVATADETRRRIERDLHDGAQQRLVYTVVTLKLARRALAQRGGDGAGQLLDEALEHAERANAALRELVQGILPASLSRGGLRAGIAGLVGRAPIDVRVDVTGRRFAAGLEATAYFIVAEALTNTFKHAHASRAHVRVAVEDGELVVEIGDDGDGGAAPNGSSGLLGLYDRAAAAGGELEIDSPPGTGTTVTARLPPAPLSLAGVRG